MSKIVESICFTGHRPQSLWGFPMHEVYDRGNAPEGNPYVKLKMLLAQYIRGAVRHNGTKTFYCGGALGVDTIAFDACRMLLEAGLEFRLVLAQPMKNQDKLWTPPMQESYRARLRLAHEVVYVLGHTGQAHLDGGSLFRVAALLEARNRYMVDNSRCVIAVYNGNLGGTHNCVEYAKSKGVDVCVIDPGTIRPQASQVRFWCINETL